VPKWYVIRLIENYFNVVLDHLLVVLVFRARPNENLSKLGCCRVILGISLEVLKTGCKMVPSYGLLALKFLGTFFVLGQLKAIGLWICIC